MFDIGWGEFLLIGIVALIVIGPKELPGVLRTLGQWMTKLRRMASEFQGQFQEAMREAEMADLKKQVDDDDRAGAELRRFRSRSATCARSSRPRSSRSKHDRRQAVARSRRTPDRVGAGARPVRTRRRR